MRLPNSHSFGISLNADIQANDALSLAKHVAMSSGDQEFKDCFGSKIAKTKQCSGCDCSASHGSVDATLLQVLDQRDTHADPSQP